MGESGEKWVSVSGKTDFRYKTDRVIGKENRNDLENMKEAQRRAYHSKTSEVLELINSMGKDGGDILEKLEKFGEVCEWEYLAKKALDEAARQVNAGNLVLAEKIFNERFVKIRYCRIKRALSVGEIKAILNNRSTFMAFYHRFDATVEIMKKEWKKIKAVGNAWRSYEAARLFIKSEGGKTAISDYSHPGNPFAEAAKARRELMDAKKKMEALVDSCNSVLALAPAGLKEYIQYNLDVFKATDAAMGIIDEYAGKIEGKLVEIDQLFARNNSSTTPIAGDSRILLNDSLRKGNEQDYNKQLDGFFRFR